MTVHPQKTSKPSLRKLYRSLLQAIPLERRIIDSKRICERVLGSPFWSGAQVVMLFVPLSDEPDITPLIEEALRVGKVCALPWYDARTDLYRPRAISDLGKDLERGCHGVMQPSELCPLVDPSAIELVIVPGLAFDRSGYRLGRGKGYYDKFLSCCSAIKCGVAFEEQLVDGLPTCAHDIRMDFLVTPSGVLSFK